VKQQHTSTATSILTTKSTYRSPSAQRLSERTVQKVLNEMSDGVIGIYHWHNPSGRIMALYRPGQAMRLPGGWDSQISRQSAHDGAEVRPTHRPPLPQEKFLVLISVRGRVDSRAIVRPEGLCKWKNPITPSGIEPASFPFVAQCSRNECQDYCLGENKAGA
jgi:hypothetical protein